MEKELQEKIEQYKKIRSTLQMYYYFMNITYWDSSTIAPKESYIERGEYLGMLSEQCYKLRTSEEFTKIIYYLYLNKDKLEKPFAHEIELIKEEIEQTKKIPMNELISYEKLLNESQVKWEEAKHKKDFSIFSPYLEKIIDYKRKEVKYLGTEKLQGYDVLLNMFEKGYTQKEYDLFFDKLKQQLVPFVKKVCNIKKKKFLFQSLEYPKEKQIEVAKYMGDVLCFDFNRGAMSESEHPYTWNTSTNNVRITNHFYLNDFCSSLFSAIHEFGHAIYEQNISPEYNGTFISGGASMAMHESQSRFFENIIGRNYHFWEIHYPKLQEIYSEQLKSVSLDDFFLIINNVEASFIRTEADELTYPLHVMLRYEIEKELINGTLEVKDLEKRWNDKMKEYFDLDVPNPSMGVLQDSHWAGGSIGYFPTYALGSAIASQLYFRMNEEFDVLKSLNNGNTSKINEWLKNKIHQFGSSKYSKDILESAINDQFNVKYYIDYLIKKYSKIYNL